MALLFSRVSGSWQSLSLICLVFTRSFVNIVVLSRRGRGRDEGNVLLVSLNTGSLLRRFLLYWCVVVDVDVYVVPFSHQLVSTPRDCQSFLHPARNTRDPPLRSIGFQVSERWLGFFLFTPRSFSSVSGASIWTCWPSWPNKELKEKRKDSFRARSTRSVGRLPLFTAMAVAISPTTNFRRRNWINWRKFIDSGWQPTSLLLLLFQSMPWKLNIIF